MKKTLIIYVLMIAAISILTLLMNIPSNFIGVTTFPRILHIGIETFNSILMLSIFFISNNLYSKTKNERFLILGGGFLFGAILNYVHVLTINVFPYDTLSLENLERHRTLIYLLLSNILVSLSIYFSLIYKPSINSKEHFRFKVYSTYFYIFILLIIAPFLFYRLLPEFINKFNIIVSSLECINYAFYIILASILINVGANNKQRCIPTFLLGLIIFGLGGVFFINPSQLPLNGILAHSCQTLGLLLILFGVPCIESFASQFKFKDELVAYLSLLLISFYVFFISITAGIFNIIFPPYSAYLFISFLLFFQLIIYAISAMSWQKVADIYTMAEREQSIIRTFETIQRISNPNIIKDTIINEIKKYFNPDKCFITLYDKDQNSFSIDRYHDNLPSRTLFDSDDMDEESMELKEFTDTFKNMEIYFARAEEYIAKNSLKGCPHEKILKKFNIKSHYSFPIYYENNLLGYLILQYTKENKELSSDDFAFLKRMANQLAISINASK